MLLSIFRKRFLVHNRGLRWAVRLLVLALMAALVLGHPWLVAWVLEWQMGRAGVEMRGPRDVTYGRVVWRELHWEQEAGLRLSVERTELGLIPRFIGTWFDPAAAVERGDWFFSASGIDVRLADTTDEDAVVPDMPGWHAQASQFAELAERWLPPMQVREVRVGNAFFEASAAHASWDGSFWTVDAVEAASTFELPVSPADAIFNAALSRRGNGLALTVRGRMGPMDQFFARLTTAGHEASMQAEGEISWEGGALSGMASWSATGWRPGVATAAGEVRQFPGTPLDRPDLPEAALQVDFRLADDTFALALEGSGVWLADQPEVGEVPWEVTLIAGADAEDLQIEQLRLRLPWLSAQLENRLTINRQTLTPAAAAAVHWETDLGTWPMQLGAGVATGRAQLAPRQPSGLHFMLEGEAESAEVFAAPAPYRELGGIRFSAKGAADRGEVQITAMHVETERWGRVDGDLSWEDARVRPLSAHVRGWLEPGAVTPWLPERVTLGSGIDFEMAFAGGPNSWRHSGTVRTGELVVADSVPLHLTASWQGTEAALQEWDLTALAPDVRMEAAGAAEWGEGSRRLVLNVLRETVGERTRWELAEPVTVAATPPEQGVEWKISPFRLENRQGRGSVLVDGEARSASAWQVRAHAEAIGAAAISGWFPIPNDQWWVERLDAQARTDNGTILAAANFDAIWRTRAGEEWSARVEARLDENGLEVVQSEVSSPTAPWLRSSGALPFALRWSENPGWRIELQRDREFRIDLEVSANEPLPAYFARLVPIDYQGLALSVHLGGTLADMDGRIALGAESIEIPVGDGERLRLLAPAVRGRVREGRVRLDTIGFRLDGADARAEAALAVEDIPWEAFNQQDWKAAVAGIRLTLRLDSFPLAAVGPFLPETVERAGSVSAELTKVGPADVNGAVSWQGIQLRPLPNGSVPRDVRGQASLDGRLLRDIDLRANISGRTVRATGTVDLSHLPEPLFDIRIDAERVDLVRQLDLILRARGVFTVTRRSLDEAPLIAGELALEESLLLRDLRDFTRQGAEGVARRPPYFAVEVEPFAGWRLDLRIRGAEFMRVRTPVFNGLLSADFRLQGTLGDPVLIGQAAIDEGNVLFPFARIPLTTGGASISLSDPHSLQLYAQGRGVAFGYDVMLQLSGTAQNPELLLSSPQGLAQDEIVLMLATGAVPASAGGSSAAERAGRMALYFGQDYISALLGRGDGSSRIEIRSGDGFSPFRRNNQVIEYRFDDEWSVLGEHDDWGDYNVDVKWNVYRR